MQQVDPERLAAVRRKAYVEDSVVRGALARVPPSWRMEIRLDEQTAVFRRGELQVMLSVSRYEDGRTWIHVSACGRTGPTRFHLPSWEQMKRVKNDFIGEDRWAYQVFPDARHYINQNPTVLHLFALLDGEPALPDFTWGLGIL
jgi:hypothetical protein